MSKNRKSGPFEDLRPTAKGDAHELCVIVDTPRGSRTKYRYDEDRRLFRLTDLVDEQRLEQQCAARVCQSTALASSALEANHLGWKTVGGRASWRHTTWRAL